MLLTQTQKVAAKANYFDFDSNLLINGGLQMTSNYKDNVP